MHFDIREVTDKSLISFSWPWGRCAEYGDYFHVCETYYDAIRTKSPSQIQASIWARACTMRIRTVASSP